MATHGEKRWPPAGRFNGRLRGAFHGHRHGSSGFGWQKAYYYHNLWTQPIVDTITYGSISGPPNDKGL